MNGKKTHTHTLACVWCCDASKFTEHENHQTFDLNMKFSGEHNKRRVQITGRHSQPIGNDTKKRHAPRCQLLHHQIKAVKEPPSSLQTTVSYGIILSHGHKSTATSTKRQFDTSNYYVQTSGRPGSSEVSYHVTSDTLGREFDPGKRDFSH